MPQNVDLKSSLDVGAKFNKQKIMKGTQKNISLGDVRVGFHVYKHIQLLYSCTTHIFMYNL